MSHSVLPPIRDILPGYLNDYPSPSNSNSPSSSSSSSSMYLPVSHLSPRLPPLDTSNRRSPSDNGHSLFPKQSRSQSRSISSFIPTPSFQFHSSVGTHSPNSFGDPRVATPPTRLHSPSEDGSVTSDQSIAAGQQSESDDDGQDQQVPTKKRRREEKKHACPYCKKLFHRPVSLGVHINTHTGEKPYTCPFPNCSRQFNVNSNMRRHYRTHFTPGTIDISQLTYSAADERFYIHAIAPTTATIGRGRYGPVTPYIPPMPSTSYGISVPSHLKSPPYSGSNSPTTGHRNNPYAVMPVSYVPVTYNNRPVVAVEYSALHHQQLPRGDLHKGTFIDGRSGDHKGQEPPRSIGRLKPASDWARSGRRGEDEDESDSDN